ncbi:MAG: hypothetical protein COB66_09200 [Coxiella sp. (in: Bacteria)]|nr:MAG: hypothetical protein COB66_09200 [Coxiella sp. (in: g-proteobacteria)]
MPNPPPGLDGLKPIVAATRDAFPDLHYVIESIVISDGHVAIHTRMQGTHRGDTVSVTGVDFPLGLNVI